MREIVDDAILTCSLFSSSFFLFILVFIVFLLLLEMSSAVALKTH